MYATSNVSSGSVSTVSHRDVGQLARGHRLRVCVPLSPLRRIGRAGRTAHARAPAACQMHVQAHPGISAEIESCAQFPAISHCQLSVLISSSRPHHLVFHNFPFSRVTYFDDTGRRHRQTSLPSAGLFFAARLFSLPAPRAC